MGLIVENAGCFTTVQDTGRPGYAAWGVSAGGAFDRASSAMANALLGNPPDCAVLEMTLVGGTYQADGPLAVALAGAPMDARIVQTGHTEHPLRLPSSFSLRPGDKLLLGHTTPGARTYLAVKGGWQTRPVLGSRSSEQPVRAGTRLSAAGASVLSRHLAEPPWQAPVEQPFRILPGPDARSNPALDSSFWSQQHFRVGSRHDRKGLRLHGAAIGVASDPERLSTPVAPAPSRSPAGN